ATTNSLTCVQVDNVMDAENKGGWNFDGGIYFDTNCPGLNTDDFNLNTVSIYPNPVKNIAKIHSDFNVQYRLINIQGQEILKGDIVSGVGQLDLSTISNGLYFLHFESTSGGAVKKIIKQ
ncbi:MAG TPA: T9SS type A sorting domain-containing protein, partial [Flavobacteriaceae bacterium]|nr:T9SS type A sorting domain-containing protein [Flavobacteriaceae bacterium]